MPTGPKGEKRPADVIRNAVKVMRILTGEEDDTPPDNGKNKTAQELGRKGGSARAKNTSPERRAEILGRRRYSGGVARINEIYRKMRNIIPRIVIELPL
jgi:hypothetical protein